MSIQDAQVVFGLSTTGLEVSVKREEWEVQHSDHTSKIDVFVDNLTVCAKLINSHGKTSCG